MQFRKINIHKNYFTYVCTFIFVFALLGIFFTYNTYQAQLFDKQRNLQITANEIAINLEELLNQTNDILLSLGKQSLVSGDPGIDTIAAVLGKKSGVVYAGDFISKINIGWVSKDDLIIFTNYEGSLEEPINIAFRPYIKECKKAPWKLCLSKPAVGIPGGLWQIPGGMGITNTEGKFIGTLAIGLNIADLNSKISRISLDKSNSFVILDNQFRIILQSPDNALDPKSSFYRDFLEKSPLLNSDEGVLYTPIKQKKITYYHYKRVSDYPYIILTGFDEITFYKELQNSIFPRLIELIGMGIISLILFFLFHHRILKLSQLSQIAKESFSMRLKSEMNIPINTIIGYSEVIRKYYNGEIDIGINEERLHNLIEEIYQNALNLRVLTTNVLNFSYVCVNTIIKDSITIHNQKASIKKITIKTSLSKAILPLWADDLRFKQIIASLISLSLEYTPKNGCIKINNFFTKENSNDVLIIILEDNGFTLDKDDLNRIYQKFDFDFSENSIDGLDLDYLSIEKLVKLHNGNINFEKLEKRGKRFTLTFPYAHSPSNNETKTSHSVKKNGQIFTLYEK